jgi:hypothetical protein
MQDPDWIRIQLGASQLSEAHMGTPTTGGGNNWARLQLGTYVTKEKKLFIFFNVENIHND